MIPAWAKAAAKKILRDLGDRSGFDGWFDDIDKATKVEIEDAIAETIAAEAPAVTA